MDNRDFRYRSMFWPVILIGVGVIWLLSNLGLLPAASIAWLLNLWPLILIVIGIDLLFGRRSPVVGGLLGLIVVGAVIFALAFAPALGLKLPNNAEVKVERFTAPLESATSATVRVDSGSEPVEITANHSDLLFDGEIGHTGVINFQTSGSTDKVVSISKNDNPGNWIVGLADQERLKWKIGLSSKVPLRLEMDSGSGSINLNLDGLQLSGLALESGSGSVQMTLPAVNKAYEAAINSGSGSVNVKLPANTDLTLRTESGSGSLNIELPAGAAVRVEALDHGSGSINLPGLTKVSSGGDEKEGTWESQGYAGAAHKILIRLENVGSGSVSIR